MQQSRLIWSLTAAATSMSLWSIWGRSPRSGNRINRLLSKRVFRESLSIGVGQFIGDGCLRYMNKQADLKAFALCPKDDQRAAIHGLIVDQQYWRTWRNETLESFEKTRNLRREIAELEASNEVAEEILNGPRVGKKMKISMPASRSLASHLFSTIILDPFVEMWASYMVSPEGDHRGTASPSYSKRIAYLDKEFKRLHGEI